MFRDNKLAAQEKEYADLKDRYETERSQRLELEKKLEKYSSVPKQPNLMVRRGQWLLGILVSGFMALISLPIFFVKMLVGVLGEWIIPVVLALVAFALIYSLESAAQQPRFRAVSHEQRPHPAATWYP